MGIFSWFTKPNIQKLAQAGNVDGLVQVLQRKDWTLRRDAAVSLATLGDRRGVDFLIAALQDPNQTIRAEAVAVLGQLRDPRAVAPLVHLLRDEALRKAAVTALLVLDDPGALEALASAVQRDEQRVAGLLAGANHQKAAALLIQALADDSAEVRCRTARTLESHAHSCVLAKGAAKIPYLIAERMMSPGRATSILSPLHFLPAKEFEVSGLSWAVVPLGKALRDQSPDVGRDAAMALLSIGTAEALDTLADYQEELEASAPAATNQVEALLKEHEERAHTLDNVAYWTTCERNEGSKAVADQFRDLYSCAATARIAAYRDRIKARKQKPTSTWKAVNPQVSCRMPFAALEQIFIFASGDGNSALDSKVTVGMLQDAAMMPLEAIAGKISMDVIGRSDVASQIIRTGTIPESAWLAMAAIKPTLAKQAQDGQYRACVRPFPTETGQTVALMLLYNKQKL